MTAFILVPGMFTGAHVWQDVAAHLSDAGAEAHPVALTGLDGPRVTRGSGVDLETHIADVVAAIDGAGEEVVLVGHDYGIHPAVGAADRRAGRVGRIVHLDSGLPRDGVPALAAVPDQSLRRRLTGAEGAGGVLPAPYDRGQWARWGSTDGVPGAALDRLTSLAAPHPLATLLQPLRLTGAVDRVPTTGVLCTGNGSSIELVQTLVGIGDPALQKLTDPRVTFFELPTGHWPMLSTPAALTDVLLRAAAGEGHRLKPVEAPAPLRPFPLDAPEIPRERHGNVDLYLPEPRRGNESRPAVLFVHGGPVPADARPTPRDWPVLVGYARYAAGEGAVGAVLDHRLHDLADYPRAAEDVAAAVELLRADPRVDADRIALWFFSGGGLLTADWLAAPPPWLRCLAATYPVLAPLPNWGLTGTRHDPVRAVAHAGDLPIVLTRVGREMPEIATTVQQFVTAAEQAKANLELIDVPDGHHSFETLDPTDETRDALRQATRSVLARLT